MALVGALQDPQGALQEKCRVRAGSAGVVQGTELFDQHFAGDQFQLEIKRALHEDLDGCLRGHGILLPWEWLVASSAVSVTYLIGGLRENLIGGNEKRGSLTREKAVFLLMAFLLVDTIEKIQHNSYYDNIGSGWEWVSELPGPGSRCRKIILSIWWQKRHKEP
jgi:hypothetical protein